jgi:hypothetical protein
MLCHVNGPIACCPEQLSAFEALPLVQQGDVPSGQLAVVRLALDASQLPHTDHNPHHVNPRLHPRLQVFRYRHTQTQTNRPTHIRHTDTHVLLLHP